MADHFYSVSFGKDLDPGAAGGGSAVVAATSTTGGSKIELRITDGVTGISGNKAVILAALEKLEAYFVKNNAPA